jgi:hypothetical protein
MICSQNVNDMLFFKTSVETLFRQYLLNIFHSVKPKKRKHSTEYFRKMR